MATPAGAGDRSGDLPDRGPGLARERTMLGWTRTAISFTAVGAAILRSDPPVGAVVLAFSAAIWSLGRLAARTVAPPGVTRRRTLRLIAAATTSVALSALAVALLAGNPPTR